MMMMQPVILFLLFQCLFSWCCVNYGVQPITSFFLHSIISYLKHVLGCFENACMCFRPITIPSKQCVFPVNNFQRLLLPWFQRLTKATDQVNYLDKDLIFDHPAASRHLRWSAFPGVPWWTGWVWQFRCRHETPLPQLISVFLDPMLRAERSSRELLHDGNQQLWHGRGRRSCCL